MEKFRFEDLKVYQKSPAFVDYVYLISKEFPVDEKYALTSQFRRASYSVPLNIGESEGGTVREYINFLRISKRSVRECVVCTTLAYRRKYITIEQSNISRAMLTELSKMISGLINSLE